MKKILTILLCTVLKILTAQVPYSNHLDNTCEWFYLRTDSDGNLSKWSYFTYYIDGDTVVNNIFYHKQYFDRLDTTRSFLFGTITVDVSTRNLSNLIREDSLNRFYILDYSSNTDSLLYDFNLSINDTFTNAQCIVTDIDSVTLNNRTLKRFLSGFFPLGSGVIEGIGYTWANYCGGFNIHGGETLVCFKRQNETLTIDTTKSCNSFLTPNKLTTSAKSFESYNNIFKVYPNPAKEYINVTFAYPNEKIQGIAVFNSIGQLMQTSHTANDNYLRINVSELKEGIFNLKVILQNGQILTKNILIVR